jgi:hypothetical protein
MAASTVRCRIDCGAQPFGCASFIGAMTRADGGGELPKSNMFPANAPPGRWMWNIVESRNH